MAESKKGNGDDSQTVTFDFIKSPQFRSIHVDGAIGGITPNGHIHISLYNERPAIPRQIIQEITPDGQLGDEVVERRVSRGGVVREMDVDAYMTVETADSLRNWLTTKIDDAKARQGSQPTSKRKKQ